MVDGQLTKKDGAVLPYGFGGPKADVYTRSSRAFKEAMAELEALPIGMPIPRGLIIRLESPAYKILVEDTDHSSTA